MRHGCISTREEVRMVKEANLRGKKNNLKRIFLTKLPEERKCIKGKTKPYFLLKTMKENERKINRIRHCFEQEEERKEPMLDG